MTEFDSGDKAIDTLVVINVAVAQSAHMLPKCIAEQVGRKPAVSKKSLHEIVSLAPSGQVSQKPWQTGPSRRFAWVFCLCLDHFEVPTGASLRPLQSAHDCSVEMSLHAKASKAEIVHGQSC